MTRSTTATTSTRPTTGMTATLTYSHQDAGALLVAQVFAKPFTQHLVLQQGSQLSLSTKDGSVGALPEVVKGLAALAGKESEALGKSDEEKKAVDEWLDAVGRGGLRDDASITRLDGYLRTRTYLAGSHLTAADLVVFGSLHAYIAKSSHPTLVSHVSVTRHFDLIQNTLPTSAVLSRHPSIFSPASVPIDLDGAPKVERRSLVEKKEKKPKKDGPAAAASPAKGAEPKATSETPAPPQAAAGAKREKKPKEKAAPAEGGGKKGGGGGGASAPAEGPPAPFMIDLRVGKIIAVEKHPDADSLYVEKIDFGEPEPRTVVSGLVNYIPIDQMRDRVLVGVCNLKPANMRGVKSFAMVLAATSKEGKEGPGSVELIAPPEGSQPGDRVFFEGFEEGRPAEQLNPKKKVFETIQPDLTTLETREACWVDPEGKTAHRIVTSRGVCKAPTFVGASLS